MIRKPHTSPEHLAYSLKELPAVLSIGVEGVRALIRTGALPSRKLGRRTLVLREDVETFLRDLPIAPAFPASQARLSPLDAILGTALEAELDALTIRRRISYPANSDAETNQ